MYNWTVYKITCTVNGKSYIGITQKAISTRLKEHIRDAFPGRYNTNGTLYALHAAIQKYGKNKFTIEPLMEGLDLQLARKNEVELIKKYNSYGGSKNKKGLPRGYNQSRGGEKPDFDAYVSDNSKEKPSLMSEKSTNESEKRVTNFDKTLIYTLAFSVITLLLYITAMF